MMEPFTLYPSKAPSQEGAPNVQSWGLACPVGDLSLWPGDVPAAPNSESLAATSDSTGEQSLSSEERHTRPQLLLSGRPTMESPIAAISQTPLEQFLDSTESERPKPSQTTIGEEARALEQGEPAAAAAEKPRVSPFPAPAAPVAPTETTLPIPAKSDASDLFDPEESLFFSAGAAAATGTPTSNAISDSSANATPDSAATSTGTAAARSIPTTDSTSTAAPTAPIAVVPRAATAPAAARNAPFVVLPVLCALAAAAGLTLGNRMDASRRAAPLATLSTEVAALRSEQGEVRVELGKQVAALTETREALQSVAQKQKQADEAAKADRLRAETEETRLSHEIAATKRAQARTDEHVYQLGEALKLIDWATTGGYATTSTVDKAPHPPPKQP